MSLASQSPSEIYASNMEQVKLNLPEISRRTVAPTVSLALPLLPHKAKQDRDKAKCKFPMQVRGWAIIVTPNAV